MLHEQAVVIEANKDPLCRHM